jgi:hypothetical protein
MVRFEAYGRFGEQSCMGLDRAHHGGAGLGPAVLLREDRIVEGAHEGQHGHEAQEPQRSAPWRFTIREVAQ